MKLRIIKEIIGKKSPEKIWCLNVGTPGNRNYGRLKVMTTNISGEDCLIFMPKDDPELEILIDHKRLVGLSLSKEDEGLKR